ncbi:Late competence development protein ComFB [Treponema pedis str. T A4]|uniref:Late competence development protein ComFB n=2 Tax=Treponema pedis TaxID=409322 RepID=S6A514_9SPIR|nr:Late competence development protein ComFB [Treponema pedis str. T A4]
MEDIVFNEVNKMFDEAEKNNEKWLTCSCMQCRLDTICYVLNRVKPRYIKSGRGLAHFLKFGGSEKNQIMADITALVIEGMHRVLSTRRPHEEIITAKSENTPVFNFPTISGKILNGSNFKPMDNVTVTLKLDNDIVPQINILWDNPYTISDKTPGTFTFCPKSIPAIEEGITKQFVFSITAEKEGFESSKISFNMELTSEGQEKSPLESSFFYDIKDLFLFAESDENI